MADQIERQAIEDLNKAGQEINSRLKTTNGDIIEIFEALTHPDDVYLGDLSKPIGMGGLPNPHKTVRISTG